MNSIVTKRTSEAFIKLGRIVDNLSPSTHEDLFERTMAKNPWFTRENIQLSLQGVANYLDEEKLDKWLATYNFEEHPTKNIGIVMAGNIPLVGFHDLLCVLISGHTAVIKLSSQDDVLLPYLLEELEKVDPQIKKRIIIKDQLKELDAIIATGSDNTARYFKYYFSKIPHIIRKNRNSCAVLSGLETLEDFQKLGRDIFSYFGLGCRNVSKLFIPDNFDPGTLKTSFESYRDVGYHHKYANNYDYQKVILLMNQLPHVDSGFFLGVEKPQIASPVSVIHYEKYTDLEEVKRKLVEEQEKIQCIASGMKEIHNAIPFGDVQKPEVWDYADHVDTVNFLLSIN